LVRDCEAVGANFSILDEAALKAAHPAFDASALLWLDPRRAAERRTSFGGTAPSEIARQVGALRMWLAGA
jgi:argininosuccinate lyase